MKDQACFGEIRALMRYGVIAAALYGSLDSGSMYWSNIAEPMERSYGTESKVADGVYWGRG